MQVGDIVEHVDCLTRTPRLVCLVRIVAETKTQWRTEHVAAPGGQLTNWNKKTLAMVPQYVSPRFIRNATKEWPIHAHAE